MGTSAGGTSAIQFALRYPDRCSALVLFSSNTPGETEAALPPEPVAKGLFKFDFIFWLVTTYFSSGMRSTMGVPEGFELTPEYEADVAEVMKTILPVNPRSDGALFERLITIESGGHMLLGHEERIRSEIVAFLVGRRSRGWRRD
jgi:pimeloyl-ACP methyl ester carboxylesterase